ncbi:hypothetical protein QAD02_009798 [Eretmocerus hayati]|uniref:Uncharacterized protein n=1 Tax=Eretmocerus hayati TaxID=131215 RepID=A0ACC2NAE8_9HYME|nr:hypothetical protein QAD02_009798 [Eretmocerus hayati]
MLGLKLLEDEKKQDDVMYYERVSLMGAMDRLHAKKDEDEKFDIHVFRNVVLQMDHTKGAEMMNALASIPSIFSSSQGLRLSNIDGLLINDKVTPVFGKSGLRGRLKIQHILNNTTLETLNDVKMFYDSAIRAVASQISQKPVFAENITKSMFLSSQLENMPLYINRSLDDNLEVMPGLNVPMYTVAGEFAFTPLQPKNGYVDFCSVVHYSEKDLARIWLCIPRQQSWPICDALTDSCQLLTETGGNSRDWLPGCVTPHHHRNMVVTPSFLDAVGIKYSIITQRPGDMIYLSSRVYYQILCVSANAEESIGVGSLAWKKQISNFLSCKCPGGEVTQIRAANTSLKHDEVINSLKFIICEVPQCGKMMKRCKRDEHLKTVHGVRNPNHPQPSCIYCKAYFGSVEWLQKHIEEKHPGGYTVKRAKIRPTN